MNEQDVPTVDEALANAARLLRNAEMTTDQSLMGHLEGLADSWRSMAGLLLERQRDLP